MGACLRSLFNCQGNRKRANAIFSRCSRGSIALDSVVEASYCTFVKIGMGWKFNVLKQITTAGA